MYEDRFNVVLEKNNIQTLAAMLKLLAVKVMNR